MNAYTHVHSVDVFQCGVPVPIMQKVQTAFLVMGQAKSCDRRRGGEGMPACKVCYFDKPP